MPNGLPMPMGPPVGNPMGGPMPGGPPGGGPQDEVGQLLALREQIDQRLSELMGSLEGLPQGAMPGQLGIPEIPPPRGMSMPSPAGPPPGLLSGAGPY